MTSTSGDGPAAGWYPDPERPDQQRYWDGAGWTEHRHPGSASGSDNTAVLPRAEQPGSHAATPAASAATTSSDADTTRSGGHGWVAALAGLIAGLVIGGTAAAVIVGNNDDSSTPKGDGPSSVATSTVTATSTATATESVTATTTATTTATATATVTVTASP
jgi:hypothetical protein